VTHIGAREIRGMLQERLRDLLARLFPQYAITFPCFTPLNPTRADKRPGSFVIYTQGAAAGGFNEYSPAGPPASGDVLDLVAYVNGRAGDRRFALAWARDFLGLRQMDQAELGRQVRQARAHVAIANAQQSEAAAAKRRRAGELWSKTVPIAGSVAEIYLASRRIPLLLVPNREEDLRFAPRLEWWKGQRWEGDKLVERGPYLPAMIAAMRNAAGDVTAVHCTFLRLDGSGKADVGEAKLMRGVAKGSAIRLTRGPSNLTVAEALANGIVEPLIVSEGVENGLTAAIACPEARVWAAGSFDLMMQAPVEAEIFDPVIYAVDNDDSPRAEAAIADRLDELRELGKRASVMRAHVGKDLNDLIRT
jgi:hypothetical protein